MWCVNPERPEDTGQVDALSQFGTEKEAAHGRVSEDAPTTKAHRLGWTRETVGISVTCSELVD